MYLTEYMKAVHTDRKRRINIHSTHCFGSGMTEEGYDEANESVIDKRQPTPERMYLYRTFRGGIRIE